MPAQAGIPSRAWMPAFAGMTERPRQVVARITAAQVLSKEHRSQEKGSDFDNSTILTEVQESGHSKNGVKLIWRALGRHVKAGNKLEVRLMLDNEDMEISCSWCGGTVLEGSPGLVREIVERFKDSGIPVDEITERFINSGMSQHV